MNSDLIDELSGYAGMIVEIDCQKDDCDGYATLDFEHPYFSWLNKGPGHPNFEQAHSQLLGAMRLAKSLRPQAKWAMWGLPRIRYGYYSEEAMALVEAPAELLAEMDWMAPSIYDQHPDDDHPDRPRRERVFIEKVMQVSREIGGDRPILAYVWHRYFFWQDNPPLPHYTLVPEEEIRLNVGLAVELGVEGIVWWGADDYYVWLINNPPPPGSDHYLRYLKVKDVLVAEKPPDLTYEEYLDLLHTRILRLLREVMPAGEGTGADPEATQLANRQRRPQIADP